MIGRRKNPSISIEYNRNVWSIRSFHQGRFNRSCKHYAAYCRSYRNEICDSLTLRCRCTDDSVYDSGQRRCRDLYCFEHCTAPGYECKYDRCQLCWTRAGQYICDRPQDVWLPVAYTALGTFLLTTITALLVELARYCRRRRHCRALNDVDNASARASYYSSSFKNTNDLPKLLLCLYFATISLLSRLYLPVRRQFGQLRKRCGS